MAATIQDVARLSGVSASTVSRAFNHSAPVNPITRERIYATAKELNYVPNASARSLSARTSRVIGVLLPLAHGEYFSVLIRGLDEAVVDARREMLIAGSHNDLDSARQAFRRMNGWVDGFLVVTHNLHIDLLLEAVPDGTPAVFLHTASPLLGYSSVQTDNRASARVAVQHLIDERHQRIGMVKGPEQNGEAIERYLGFQEALRENGLTLEPDFVLPGDFTREGGIEAGRRLLDLNQRPTAVFAANDDTAIGLMFVLQEAGWRIPDDLALIGFDDIPSSRYQTPSLSTIHIPIAEMGRRAVGLLVDAMEDPEGRDPQVLMFRGLLRPRSSTIGSRYRAEMDPPDVPLTGTR
ncbi:MAG TPA: LacI family DNA-binding transcriptional regulator [Rhodothermales bacterium]|nr:LacI family DNA-binding transcriptional regulator [Rhodothermales bacterium]